jgi:chaperonin cofactor prefoldin
MSTDADRLHAIQGELEEVLETRLTELMTTVKAAQAVNARLAATQAEIQRQEHLRTALEADLEPLEARSESLSSDNDKLQAKVEQLKANIRQMRARRQELVGTAKQLSAEAKRQGKG